MLNHAAMIRMSQPEDISEWFCVDFTNSTVDGSVTISSATKNSFRTNLGVFSAGDTIAVPKGSKLFMKGVNTVQSLFTGLASSNAWKLDGTNIRISGNIQTLLGDEKQDGVGDYAFNYLFYNSPLVDAGELMLPATTLADYCYYGMFTNCTSLTQAPTLPATTLADYCYSDMFNGCTSLTQAPALPATTLASCCYSDMFYGCTSLTQAPTLPATTLESRCYYYMFRGCTSLTQAPTLPATTLESRCYYYMFNGCTKLNYIKCLATDVKVDNTMSWVSGVASEGTFVKNKNESNWPSGNNGIPSGWTVQNA